MRAVFLLIYTFFFIAIHADTAGRDTIFNITPEQMVFASKLNDYNRRIYCHKFSLTQRQEAIERWKLQEKSSLDEQIALCPNDLVQSIVEKNTQIDDFLMDNSKTR